MDLQKHQSKNPIRLSLFSVTLHYLLLGVVVGGGVAAPVAGGAGVMFQVIIRFFQASPSRTAIDE
jgi:hypothetical protein